MLEEDSLQGQKCQAPLKEVIFTETTNKFDVLLTIQLWLLIINMTDIVCTNL